MRTYTVVPQGEPKTQMDGNEQGGRPEWRLLEDLWFRIDGLILTIPAGFLFDYASVPRGLWNTFPPIDPHYGPAALCHDWLCATELLPRREADTIFLDAMRYANVLSWKRALMWMAVRLGSLGRADSLTSVLCVRGMVGITSPVRPMWASLEEGIAYAKRNKSKYFGVVV